MRIAINASFLRKQNTGIGQVTANFIKELTEVLTSERPNFSKDLEIFLYLEEDIELELPEENTASSSITFHKIVFLPPWKRDDLIRKIWWEIFSLPQKIKKDNCDVLFSLYQSPTVLHSMLRNKLCNKKVTHIMLVHDLIPKLFPEYLNNWRKKLYQILTERAIKKADRIITVSHRSEKDLIQQLKIDPKKISVSYIDVDKIYKKEISKEEKEKVLQKYGLEQGYIYTGGGLEVRKNTESVLRAYKILLEAYGHANWLPKLVVSGKLMPELAPLICDVEAVVEGLAIKQETKVLGFVEQEDLPAIYNNAALFVYPSFYEGFGLPVLEAMSQGVPVIAAKTSSLPEVGSDAVVYCNPKDVDDLAMVMKNVLMNNHLQSALSLKGRERSLHFSWEKFVKKTLNIIYEYKN